MNAFSIEDYLDESSPSHAQASASRSSPAELSKAGSVRDGRREVYSDTADRRFDEPSFRQRKSR